MSYCSDCHSEITDNARGRASHERKHRRAAIRALHEFRPLRFNRGYMSSQCSCGWACVGRAGTTSDMKRLWRELHLSTIPGYW